MLEPIPRARLTILVAALLWSTSGFFAKVILLPGPSMAFFRVLFAALFLWIFLAKARGRRSLRPAHWGMMGCFALMNVSFVTAMTLTTAANSIFLQYTGPVWMVLFSTMFLHEPLEKKNLLGVGTALIGIFVIVWGTATWDWGVVLALVAGVSYAGIAVFLRYLRDEDSVYLTVLNHAAAAVVLLPYVAWGLLSSTAPFPNGEQILLLVLFGVFQMGVPYVLFAKGLTRVSPQEAGILTLVEPVLSPIWAYLSVAEQPSTTTLIGGGLILSALIGRYLAIPRRRSPYRG